jgi:hypothetical protein
MPAPNELVPMLAEFQDAAGHAHDVAELIGEIRRLAGRSRAADRREALRLLPPLLAAEERAVARAQASSRRLLARIELKEFEWS